MEKSFALIYLLKINESFSFEQFKKELLDATSSSSAMTLDEESNMYKRYYNYFKQVSSLFELQITLPEGQFTEISDNTFILCTSLKSNEIFEDIGKPVYAAFDSIPTGWINKKLISKISEF
jgi:hypothetical protein